MTGDETIKINDLTLCHKHSSPGLVRSTLPDVCRSPTTPVPYVNVAYARDLEDGTTTVFSHGGAMNGIKGSRLYPSYGDEPGTGGGVKSGVNLHEATWLSWSPNVFMEGKPVTRLTDKMHMNRRNTVSIGGYYTKWPEGSKEAILCDIGCFCWTKNRGSSKGRIIVDNPVGRRLFQSCFESAVKANYPNTALGQPGQPGLASEIGFWDPNNPSNTAGGGKPPGEPIGKISPWSGGGWFNVRGSRWMDATWIDQSGSATDMWDIKFGSDPPNAMDKASAYRAIARQNGAKYHGDFRVPDECDECATAEEEWQRENGLSRLGRDLERTIRENPPLMLPIPGRRFPVPRW